MDRDRFRNRADELRAFAERMTPLTKMPDRVTAADLQLAVDLANKAANHIDELVKATPPGCICRRIDNDNYSYLDYAEACIHHRQYYFLREELKRDYQKMETALKAEVRMKLIAAALGGTATPLDARDIPQAGVGTVVERAIELADETIRRISRGG